MKTYVVVLALLMVLVSAICASASDENLPARGARRLMFGFSGWGLSNYKGGVGLRYYLRENTALRFGLDVNWSKDDDTGWDHDVYEEDEPEQSAYTTERSTFSVGLGTVLERHFRSSHRVRPYAGLGMFWWYDKSDRDETFERTDEDYTRTSVFESRGYTIEGLLLAGLQWYFAPNMSLGGEYRVSLTYSRTEQDSKGTRTETNDDYSSTDHDTRKDYRLTVDASRLWLSIAF